MIGSKAHILSTVGCGKAAVNVLSIGANDWKSEVSLLGRLGSARGKLGPTALVPRFGTVARPIQIAPDWTRWWSFVFPQRSLELVGERRILSSRLPRYFRWSRVASELLVGR